LDERKVERFSRSELQSISQRSIEPDVSLETRISIFTGDYNVIDHVTHPAEPAGVVDMVDSMEYNFGSYRNDSTIMPIFEELEQERHHNAGREVSFE
jgi:hypothetical protein